jgi:ribosomal protein S12 methylthiotransferase
MTDQPTQSQNVFESFAETTVYLLSLGCAKNLVDSECMSKIMQDAGFSIVQEPGDAVVLVVNTCGFIESAKREAIQSILDLAEYKKPDGKARILIVAGCLPQRYAKEIHRDLPEVDAVIGTADYARIAELIVHLLSGQVGPAFLLPGQPGSLDHLAVGRVPSTPGRYAYLKIAEGCDNCCSYCAIPGIRGSNRSRPLEDILNEAARLANMGKDEIILIAQDTTRYGQDIYGRPRLADLLDSLCKLENIRMIRVMYAYADGMTDELISTMAKSPQIAHYLDMPIQHAADSILSRMNRRDSQSKLRQVIGRLRDAMPDIILRTTVLVGFPGETDEEFSQLMSFLKEIRFDRLGCFVYSPEEGTAAYLMKPRTRPSVARMRRQEIMKLAQAISAKSNAARIGRIYPVALESADDRGIFFLGRSYGEAPEVDPVIYVAGSSEDVRIGQVYPVRLVDAGEYDMTGVTVL